MKIRYMTKEERCNHIDRGKCRSCRMEAQYNKQLNDLKERLNKHIDGRSSNDLQQIMICCGQINNVCAKLAHMLNMKEMV